MSVIFGDQENERLHNAQVRPAYRAAALQLVLFGLLYLAIGLAVMFVGPDIASGVNAGDPNAITPGELAAFFKYLLTALIPIMIVAFVLPELGKFEASLARAVEVFETTPDVIKPDDAIDPGVFEGRIEFRNVAMSYLDGDAEPGPVPVLRDVNLTIGLYELATRSYLDRAEAWLFSPLSEGADDGYEDVKTFLGRLREGLNASDAIPGCLIVNDMATGSAPEATARYRGQLESGLAKALTRASHPTPEADASLLSAAVLGVNLVSKSTADSMEVDRLLDSLMATVLGWQAA